MVTWYLPYSKTVHSVSLLGRGFPVSLFLRPSNSHKQRPRAICFFNWRDSLLGNPFAQKLSYVAKGAGARVPQENIQQPVLLVCTMTHMTHDISRTIQKCTERCERLSLVSQKRSVQIDEWYCNLMLLVNELHSLAHLGPSEAMHLVA